MADPYRYWEQKVKKSIVKLNSPPSYNQSRQDDVVSHYRDDFTFAKQFTRFNLNCMKWKELKLFRKMCLPGK